MRVGFAKHSWVLAGVLVLGLAGCGDKGARQDASEPAGTFPVRIVKAKFPSRQHVGETLDLELAVRNEGQDEVPDLSIDVFADPDASRPFAIRSKQTGLAQPDRPVWILENGYPRLAGSQASAGATTATRAIYQFGPLAPGETKDVIWKVSPVKGGTYTLNYKVDAGISGKAVATTTDGKEAAGKFIVTISTETPQVGVDDKGRVVTIKQR